MLVSTAAAVLSPFLRQFWSIWLAMLLAWGITFGVLNEAVSESKWGATAAGAIFGVCMGSAHAIQQWRRFRRAGNRGRNDYSAGSDRHAAIPH